MVHQRDRTADIVAHVNLGKLSMIDLAGASENKLDWIHYESSRNDIIAIFDEV